MVGTMIRLELLRELGSEPIMGSRECLLIIMMNLRITSN